LIRKEFAVGTAYAFRYDDGTVAVFLDQGADPLQEFVLVEGHLGKQDDHRQVRFFAGCQAAGGGDPAGVASHDLEHEYLGGGLAHRRDVEAGLEGRDGYVLGHRAEAGAVVGDGQVVVHRLGDVDRLNRIAQRLGDL